MRSLIFALYIKSTISLYRKSDSSTKKKIVSLTLD